MTDNNGKTEKQLSEFEKWVKERMLDFIPLNTPLRMSSTAVDWREGAVEARNKLIELAEANAEHKLVCLAACDIGTGLAPNENLYKEVGTAITIAKLKELVG